MNAGFDKHPATSIRKERMFKLLADLLEHLFGGAVTKAFERAGQVAMKAFFAIAEVVLIADAAGLLGGRTLERVLCGIGAVIVPPFVWANRHDL